MTNLALYYRICDAVKHHYFKSKRYGNIPMEEFYNEEMFKLSIKVHVSSDFEAVRNMINERGWKSFTQEEIIEIQNRVFKRNLTGQEISFMLNGGYNKGLPSVYERHLNIIYNRKQDKVAINFRDTGFSFNYGKSRYYPNKTTDPILTKTKKFWWFKKTKGELKVREFKINHQLPDAIEYAMRKIFKLSEIEDRYDVVFYTHRSDDNFGAPDLLFRKVLESSDLVKGIEESHKVSFPKAIKRHFHVCELPIIAKLIEPDDYNKICQILSKFYDGDDKGLALETVIQQLYASQFEDHKDFPSWAIRDAMYEHLKLSRKLNLKIKSYKRLMQIHEECSSLLRNRYSKPISVKKKFLKCFNGFKGDYELITTRARLNKEGEQMIHCVAGYAKRINQGRCCIVSILWEDGHRYTAEIRHLPDINVFYIEQLQGYKNSIHGSPPKELYEKIFKECGIHNTHPLLVKSEPDAIPV